MNISNRTRATGGAVEVTCAQSDASTAFPSFVLLGLCTTVAPLAMSSHLPALTQIVRDLGTSYQWGQLTVTVYLVGFALSMLASGALLDGVRPRVSIMGALLAFVCGSFCSALAPNIVSLLVARFLQSLGAGVLVIVPYAVVQEALSGAVRVRAISVITALYSIAAAAAPLLGGCVSASAGWRADFWLSAVAGILMLCWFERSFPRLYVRQKPVLKQMEVLNRGARLLFSGKFCAYTLVQIAGAAVFYGFFSAGPVLLISRLGVSEVNFGIIMSLFCAFLPVGNYLAPPLCKLTRASNVMLIGAAINLSGAAVIMIMSSMPNNIWSIVVPMILFAVGYGICSPLAVSRGARVDIEISGYASAIMFSSTMLCGALFGWVISLMRLDCTPKFGAFCALSSVIMLLAIYHGVNKSRKAKPKALPVASVK